MELVNDFTVPVPAQQAWDLLVDVEKISQCLPGAAITSVDGDSFEGGLKVKVGPIGMTFKGDGAFLEKNESKRRAILEAKGRDAKGNGGAQAKVTTTLREREDATDVHVVTNLTMSGKAAQFGTGVVKDVSDQMLAQFADNLSHLITDVPGTTPATVHATPASEDNDNPLRQPQTSTTSDNTSVDAMGLLLGSETLQRTAKSVVALVAGLVVGYLYGKNRMLERTLRRD